MTAAPQETTASKRVRTDARLLHRQQTRRHILLPFLAAVVVILLLLTAALLLQRRVQVSLIADLMFTLLVLCPLVVCLFPVYLLLVASVWGMGRLHDGTQRPLHRLADATERFTDSLITRAGQLNRGSIAASERLAAVLSVTDVLDSPDSASKGKQDEPHTG